MTLSRWFRDYVYIPLGGSRGPTEVTVRNLMLVFFLTGAWHGAAWTFVLWGLYNGVLLVVERLTGVSRWADERLAVGRRAFTFLLVVLGWVLFRSHGLGQANDFYAAMASFDFGSLAPNVDAVLGRQQWIALTLGLASVALPRDFVTGKYLMGAWSGAPLAARLGVVALTPYAAIVIAAGSFSPFLYFQF
jgi:alginate O-acetyltransferase complex protein AlgI